MTSNFLCFEALHIVSAKFHLNKALYINLLLYIFLMLLIHFAKRPLHLEMIRIDRGKG